jgi:hypothetical protein
MSTELTETKYGFTWGKAKVERIASHKGYLFLGVTTPRDQLEIRITPTGLIRTRRTHVKRTN